MQPMLTRRILTSLSSSSTHHSEPDKTAPIPIPARKPGTQTKPPLTRIEELFHNRKPESKGKAKVKAAPPKPAPRADLKSHPVPPTLTPLTIRGRNFRHTCPWCKKRPLRRNEEYRLVVLGGAAQWITYAANPARAPEAREMLAEAAGKHDDAFQAFKEEIERTQGCVDFPEEMKGELDGDGLREKTREEEDAAGTGLEEDREYGEEEQVAREAMVECECGREEAEARVGCGHRGCLL